MSKINILVICIISIIAISALYLAILYDLTPVTTQNDFGISARIIHGFDDRIMCPIRPCDTSFYLMQLNSEMPAFVTGYNICNGLACNRNDDLSVFVGPENDPRNQMVHLAKDPPWKVGDTVNIRLKVSGATVADGKNYPDPHMTTFLDLGSSKVVEQKSIDSGQIIGSALETAKNFVKSSPTFAFDGIAESLKLDPVGGTEAGARIDGTFYSKHPGYGNRAGQSLEELTVMHTIRMWIEDDRVKYAYMDGQWDEMNQKPMKSGMFLTVYRETNSTFLDISQTKFIDIQCTRGGNVTGGGYDYSETPQISVPFSEPIDGKTYRIQFVNAGNTSGTVSGFVTCQRTEIS